MASSILIPLKAIFDDRGIKEAQSEFAKLGKSMKGLLGAAGIAVGLGAVVSGLKAAATAAAEDNKSQALLATQLQNTVGATDGQIAATERSISAMQLQASVADDTIRPALAALVRATGDLGDATQLTSLALDVSAGTGKDVQSVAIALGKAYQGNTTALQRMGINVKGMKDPMAELAKQFEGSAKAAAETDPMQRLEIIFGELAEQVGIALLPALNDFADWMSDPVHAQEAQNLAATIGGAFGVILTEVAGLIEGLAVVGWSLDNLFKNPMEVFKVLGMTIGEGYDYIMKKQNEAMKNGKKTAAFVLPDFTGLTGGSYTGGTVNTGLTDAQKKAEAAAKAAAKKAAAARQAIVDAAKKAAEEAKQAFDDMKSAVDSFNTSFAQTGTEFKNVFKFAAPLDAFSQQTVDAFDTIRASAQEAFDSKLITAKSLASLQAYADREQTLLVGIAKQRDVLAKKISIAQSITSGVMGSLNITSMLETQTKQVTKSVSSLVNGIALTTTQTFDEVVSGGLTDSFKKLVDKTKTFATNLTKLKTLGLNGNLFKQIVDAGAEAGNATAEAIIAGGADTVKELNGLFKELTDAGSDIAKTSTPILYDLGENMTNSFIDGLRSEDQKLIDTATSMAALFTAEFKKQLDLAIAPTVGASLMSTISPSYGKFSNYVTGALTGYSGDALNNQINMLTGADVSAPGSFMNSLGYMNSQGSITVNVNAGVISDKAALPGIVTDALVTASKQGLTGGLSRILAI